MLEHSFGDEWEIKYLKSYQIHIWLNKNSSFLRKIKLFPFNHFRTKKFCTLRGFINETKIKLDSFLGHYKMTSTPLSIQLEENFADYIEKFGFITIDIPFKNNTFCFYRNF